MGDQCNREGRTGKLIVTGPVVAAFAIPVVQTGGRDGEPSGMLSVEDTMISARVSVAPTLSGSISDLARMFGDGSKSTGSRVSRAYDEAGSSMVNVAAADVKDGTSESSVAIEVTGKAGGLSATVLAGIIVAVLVVVGGTAIALMRRRKHPSRQGES